MADQSPFNWRPDDIVEITNTSKENFLLELPSGTQRLDAGRSISFTGATLDLPGLAELVNAGKISVDVSKRKKFPWQLRSSS